jgi:hypothetical protein
VVEVQEHQMVVEVVAVAELMPKPFIQLYRVSHTTLLSVPVAEPTQQVKILHLEEHWLLLQVAVEPQTTAQRQVQGALLPLPREPSGMPEEMVPTVVEHTPAVEVAGPEVLVTAAMLRLQMPTTEQPVRELPQVEEVEGPG